jgi:hypothetical protein
VIRLGLDVAGPFQTEVQGEACADNIFDQAGDGLAVDPLGFPGVAAEVELANIALGVFADGASESFKDIMRARWPMVSWRRF